MTLMQSVFDLSGGLTLHWLRMTPILVTVKFGLGVSDSTPEKGQKSKFVVKSHKLMSDIIQTISNNSFCNGL